MSISLLIWNLIHTIFIRTLRFELHCWFVYFDGFEHQNVLNFSLIQALCMFLVIYGFVCSYCIRRYTTIMENVGISMNCSQYIIILLLYSQYTVWFIRKIFIFYEFLLLESGLTLRSYFSFSSPTL